MTPLSRLTTAALNKSIFLLAAPHGLLARDEQPSQDAMPVFIRILSKETDRDLQMVELLLANGESSKWGQISVPQAHILYGDTPAGTRGDALDSLYLPVGDHLAAAVARAETDPASALSWEQVFIAATAEGRTQAQDESERPSA
ncbi:hypothetical protein [Polaromonas sp.]|uniref:hypothetical protein n=1 Tax=Polaromonas sp. TaxID=1869339 RepID=UPI00352AFEB2